MDRLITALRLAGATTVEQAKAVLQQFLSRFNRRFGVPPRCPDTAFRTLTPDLPLEQVLCFKHHRRVARDNTVKYQRHTLQLLPDSKRRSYAGTVVEVLEGLDGRLSLHHQGRIIASQGSAAQSGNSPQGRRDSGNRSYPDPRSQALVNSFGERSRTAELPGRSRR